MTLDWLDRAFVGRLVPLPRGAVPEAVVPAPQPEPGGMNPVAAPVTATVAEGPSIVDRLLEAVPSEWDGLADAVHASAREGRRVVAVTGGKRGEGRSTVVAGIEAVLRRRGARVMTADRPPLLQDTTEAHGCRAADVVLVDAGPWFNSGPIRRAHLERAALGYDAVLLVRRADAPPCPAWQKALEMVGLPVIGEALTFVPPAAQE
jgi:hypothetical protein